MKTKEIYKGVNPDNLRQLREECGLSQEKLAEEFQEYDGCEKCSAQNISNWERGKTISYKFINAYLAYFDCTLDYLHGLSEFPNETLEDKQNRLYQKKIDTAVNVEIQLRNIARSYLASWLSLNGYKYVRSIMNSRPSVTPAHSKICPGAVKSDTKYVLASYIYSKDPNSEESKIFHPQKDEIAITAKDLHCFPKELLQYTEMRLRGITAYNDFSTMDTLIFDEQGNQIKQ